MGRESGRPDGGDTVGAPGKDRGTGSTGRRLARAGLLVGAGLLGLSALLYGTGALLLHFVVDPATVARWAEPRLEAALEVGEAHREHRPEPSDAMLEDALEAPFESRWVFDVELIARLRDRIGPDSEAWIEERPLRAWRDVGGSKLGVAQALGAARDLLGIAWRSTRRPRRVGDAGDGASGPG